MASRHGVTYPPGLTCYPSARSVHLSRIGQEPAKLLAMFSPPGMEQFFDEAVDLDVTDTEAYVAKANALAEKYNMVIVGPPLEP